MDAARETSDSGSRIDAWADLSTDVIARFIDVMEVEYELSRAARHGYRKELAALDDWMRRMRGRALPAARCDDLWTYLHARLAGGARPREFERLLMCLQHFYRHLKESGYRGDNPAAQLCDILASSAVHS
jgi:site-specific recombinase XerD